MEIYLFLIKKRQEWYFCPTKEAYGGPHNSRDSGGIIRKYLKFQRNFDLIQLLNKPEKEKKKLVGQEKRKIRKLSIKFPNENKEKLSNLKYYIEWERAREDIEIEKP